MTTTIRIDDALKRDCEAILGDIGLTMSGAVTLFLRQVVKQRAIPFVLSSERRLAFASCAPFETASARRAQTARRYAAEMRDAGDREWTMEEIDAEIAASRSERAADMGRQCSSMRS